MERVNEKTRIQKLLDFNFDVEETTETKRVRINLTGQQKVYFEYGEVVEVPKTATVEDITDYEQQMLGCVESWQWVMVDDSNEIENVMADVLKVKPPKNRRRKAPVASEIRRRK